ncbi:uncharacterized protein Ecym_3431 [Eremothecium cymbalariae DBVPG|uniref:Uncharacterized protein n=1 Tax=Eremothecium cymbalariae (strain CBS 270.75 / DBVPG 7215 / KCTC 17166 / NRRL Y-17582) TaxID=931890 RepID=G8JRZ8_ERECY|nr:Hypothetical protein Ecym_3431 [Eremothecium cymbalariae DBVPG\
MKQCVTHFELAEFQSETHRCKEDSRNRIIKSRNRTKSHVGSKYAKLLFELYDLFDFQHCLDSMGRTGMKTESELLESAEYQQQDSKCEHITPLTESDYSGDIKSDDSDENGVYMPPLDTFEVWNCENLLGIPPPLHVCMPSISNEIQRRDCHDLCDKSCYRLNTSEQIEIDKSRFLLLHDLIFGDVYEE